MYGVFSQSKYRYKQPETGKGDRMLWGTIALVSSIGLFITTERCRRNPEMCRDGFMTSQGFTRSIFALKYLGRSQDARDAIVTDPNLRHRYILESYIWSGVAFLLALVSFFYL